MENFYNIYEKICSFENLLLAWQSAKKGKTKRRYVKRFQRNLKANLKKLQEELINQTYKPCSPKTFILRDPKTRKISKSAFRDRVVVFEIRNKEVIIKQEQDPKIFLKDFFDTPKIKRKISVKELKEIYNEQYERHLH